jgi:hypothetical protein
VLTSVGPVASVAARNWASHLLANLDAVERTTAALPFRLPNDVADNFRLLLTEWLSVAGESETFMWSIDIDPEPARVLVQYWANLDSLRDEHLDAIGIDWSPPNARPFFIALARAVDEAFRGIGEDNPFARLLAERAERIAAEEPTAC